MDAKQRAHYKKLGEEMYGTIDFEDRKSINNLPPCTKELVSYLDTVLRSGFHPRYLNKTEIETLFGHCGDKWYEKYGFTFEDLPQLKGTSFDKEETNEKQIKKYMKETLDKNLEGIPEKMKNQLKDEFIKHFKKK